MSNRDRAPIDQEWIRNYTDELMKIAVKLDDDPAMRAAVALRVEYVQDLVEAWQLRKGTLDERDALKARK